MLAVRLGGVARRRARDLLTGRSTNARGDRSLLWGQGGGGRRRLGARLGGGAIGTARALRSGTTTTARLDGIKIDSLFFNIKTGAHFSHRIVCELAALLEVEKVFVNSIFVIWSSEV